MPKRSDREERRILPAGELRVETREDGGAVITGYAAVFGATAEIWDWTEEVAPGAFDAVLEDDVRALFNHDPNFVLGRRKSGTLRLEQDDRGLRMEVDAPEAQWARDLVESIKRGDISGQSFSFIVDTDSWRKKDGKFHRTILKLGALFDVGPVTFPAYEQTDVSARAAGLYLPRPPRVDLSGYARRSRAAAKDARRQRVAMAELKLKSRP